MIFILFYLFILMVLVEATTELIVKGSIFLKLRVFLSSKSTFLEELVSCGYCFSVWAALFWNFLMFLMAKVPMIVVEPGIALILLNYFLYVILTHRMSNYLHGISDRIFSTRKDIRYNRLEDT